MEDLVFEQRRSQHRTRITFGDASMTSYVEDQHHASTIRVDYDELPFETREHTDKIQPARAASIFVAFCAVYGLVSYWLGGSFMASPPSVAVFQLVVAGAFELGYQLTKTEFTVFDTYRGSVYVIKDGQSEGILSELTGRRDEQIRQRHGEVDKLVEPDRERQRFALLLEKGVIDRARFERALAEIDDGDLEALPSPTVPTSGKLH